MSHKRLFVFDRYRLDEQERQLLLGTRVVPLAPKAFDLLAVLVQNAGRLIPKQDLLNKVWRCCRRGQPDPWHFVAATGARFDCRWTGLYSDGIEARISFHLASSRDNRR